MKVCDITQFYAPRSGGVKRYLHEKIRFIQRHRPNDQHVLIVPGAATQRSKNATSRIYEIAAPRVPGTGGYRALLDLRAIDEVLAAERPDVIECADPYQLGWKTIASARMFRIPAIAFYHSHFPEAYLLPLVRQRGARATVAAQRFTATYLRKLYNGFLATLVSSPALAHELQQLGVRNVRQLPLGIDAETFQPAMDGQHTRDSLGIPPDRTVLLYVGRLAPEKNVRQLFAAFGLLERRTPGKYHLLVIGDGPERPALDELRRMSRRVSSVVYCETPSDLAKFYGAADLFVHPGVRETFGLAALEAQACGTPVVGIRGSRMDDVIMHDQKSWAGENSAEALAAAVEAMSARDLKAIGASAASLARERYAWPRIFDELFCVYREVCAKYKAAAE